MCTCMYYIMCKQNESAHSDSNRYRVDKHINCCWARNVLHYSVSLVDIGISTSSYHPCSIMILFVYFLVLPSLLHSTIYLIACLCPFLCDYYNQRRSISWSLWLLWEYPAMMQAKLVCKECQKNMRLFVGVAIHTMQLDPSVEASRDTEVQRRSTSKLRNSCIEVFV